MGCPLPEAVTKGVVVRFDTHKHAARNTLHALYSARSDAKSALVGGDTKSCANALRATPNVFSLLVVNGVAVTTKVPTVVSAVPVTVEVPRLRKPAGLLPKSETAVTTKSALNVLPLRAFLWRPLPSDGLISLTTRAIVAVVKTVRTLTPTASASVACTVEPRLLHVDSVVLYVTTNTPTVPTAPTLTNLPSTPALSLVRRVATAPSRTEEPVVLPTTLLVDGTTPFPLKSAAEVPLSRRTRLAASLAVTSAVSPRTLPTVLYSVFQ